MVSRQQRSHPFRAQRTTGGRDPALV